MCFFHLFFFDKRTRLLCCNSGWKSLRRMWQQLPFLLLFSPCFPSILSSVFHDWRICYPAFFSLFAILISESHQAPPASSGCKLCDSRICRSARVLATPWLTWLLRGRNWQNRNVKTPFFQKLQRCNLGPRFLQKHLILLFILNIMGLMVIA